MKQILKPKQKQKWKLLLRRPMRLVRRWRSGSREIRTTFPLPTLVAASLNLWRGYQVPHGKELPSITMPAVSTRCPRNWSLQWQQAYPAVDLLSELRRMEAWASANPVNRKSNWQRFIVNWLTRAQDRAGRGGRRGGPPAGDGELEGFEMLKDVESPWPLAEIVYQHHERIDGSGYPTF